MTDLFPTHTCFDDCIKNIIWLMERGDREAVARGDILIVHAIIAPEGERLSHGWIEKGPSVFFTSILNGERVLVEADRDDYLRRANIERMIRYTLFEAYAEEKRTGHYGPWDSLIRNMCNDSPHRPRQENNHNREVDRQPNMSVMRSDVID